jgi:hypothetical protein
VFDINFLIKTALQQQRPTRDNKNPRMKIRGKAAGSLPEEARKLRRQSQFAG